MFKKVVAKFSSLAAKREFDQFMAATNNIEEVQRKLFFRQLKIVSGSSFAEDYRLRDVYDYSDYIKRVPILRYEDLLVYVERLKKGDFAALFSRDERLLMFALTSGTTARPKFIPVTRRFVKDYRRGWNVFGLRAILDHPQVFLRKILQITSSEREILTQSGLWAGAITGLLARTQKWIVKRHYTTPQEVAYIKDPEDKMYVIARLSVGEDVSFISTANPSTLIRLAKTIEGAAELLIRDLYDGSCSIRDSSSQRIIEDLKCKGYIQRRRDTAKRLEGILRSHGRILPKYIWDLGFLANWTGGTLKLYLKSFPEYFGNVPVRDIGLLASEGRFSIPIEDNTPAGILEITSNFFEFIPEDEYGTDNPEVLLPNQLKVGQRYFIVFSNATGFCRYDLGDLIKVVDFYNKTPVIEFLNKGAHISSVTGEKLTEHQVVEAVDRLGRIIGRKIDSFYLQPLWADPPCYEFSVEKALVSDLPYDIAELLDSLLQEINIEYRSKRKSARLGPVVLNLLEDGYFHSDDLAKLRDSGRPEQYKRKFLITEIKQLSG